MKNNWHPVFILKMQEWNTSKGQVMLYHSFPYNQLATLQKYFLAKYVFSVGCHLIQFFASNSAPPTHMLSLGQSPLGYQPSIGDEISIAWS